MAPRDGSGVYHTPAGTDGTPGFTVESARYNVNVHDVEQDLNLVRPIVSGGTGSSSAGEALVRLSGEQAYQTIVDYDLAVFSPGSFKSATTAINSPVANHAFSGICTTLDGPPTPATAAPPNVDLVLTARDQTSTDVPGLSYVRQKKAGVWGSWAIDGTDFYVHKAGDIMSGNLSISRDGPRLLLNNPGTTPGMDSDIVSSVNWIVHWQTVMGGSSPEINYEIRRFSDTGDPLNTPMSINYSTGEITFTGVTHVNGDFVSNSIYTTSATIDGNLVVNNHTVVNDLYWAGAAVGTIPGAGNTNVGGTLTNTGDGAILSVSKATPGVGIFNQNNDGALLYFKRSGSLDVGNISIDTASTFYNTSSDARQKTDLREFDAGPIIDGTKVYDFQWKVNGKRSLGVIAQEAVTVYPAAVSHDTSTDQWAVDYSKYVPLLLQEVKTLRQQVQDLIVRIALLEGG